MIIRIESTKSVGAVRATIVFFCVSLFLLNDLSDVWSLSSSPVKKSNNYDSNTRKNRYKSRQQQQERERERRQLRNKLQRARDSISFYGKSRTNGPPSTELQSILPKIVDSYASGIVQSSKPTLFSKKSDSDEFVPKLFDPWEARFAILKESRPVQSRFLGLLSVLIQITTHIEEEYSLYGGGYNRRMSQSQKEAIDRIQYAQSQVWKTIREVLRDMTVVGDIEQTDKDEPTLPKKSHLVSHILISSLAKALRDSNIRTRFISSNDVSGVEEINELIHLVNDARKKNGTKESDYEAFELEMALATARRYYLLTLCDRALVTKNPRDSGLETAANLVLQNHNEGIVKRNTISYNVVMNTAAKLGNATLVDKMWQDLTRNQKVEKEQRFPFSLQPNSVTYNSRLTVANDDQQRLDIFDNEIIPAASDFKMQKVSSDTNDSFSAAVDCLTLNLIIMPLLRAKRKKELFRLIDYWMELITRQHNKQGQKLNQKQQKIANDKIQRAFKSNLLCLFATLVQQNGDLRTARELWNRYMVLKLDEENETTSSVLNNTNVVHPERRHYNVLLDGYARLVEKARDREARYLDRPEDKIPSQNKKTKRKTKIWNRFISNEETNVLDDSETTSTTSEFYEEVQERAIHDGQELYALMLAHQQQPDTYTKSTMIRLCRSGLEVQNVLQTSSGAPGAGTWLPRAVAFSAVTTCGRLGDPSMACTIFDQYISLVNPREPQKRYSNCRAFNVLLGALAAGAKLDNEILNVLPINNESSTSFLLEKLHGLTCTEAVVCLMNLMTSKNSQTYCVAASALQYAPIHERTRLSQFHTNSTTTDTTPLSLQIFNNATRDGVQINGKLVNAIFRCYGDDIAGALNGWKTQLRRATWDFEKNNKQGYSDKNVNLLSAYNGLFYVCGRAERPDIAVRISYAMKKEGLNPQTNPYNNYQSGKSTRKMLLKRDKEESRWGGILPKLDMVKQYENVLYVECTEYDTRNRKMEKDDRIRIII